MRYDRQRFVGLIVPLVLVATAAPSRANEMQLTVRQAVARALQHNLSLQQERLAPALSDAPELVAQASFEPLLFTEISGSYSPGLVSFQRAGLAPTSATNVGGQAGLRKSFSTGTSAELGFSNTALFGGGMLDPAYQSNLTLSVSQSLLRGISRSANEVEIVSARLSRDEARRKLRQLAEQTAASALEAYFDLHAALAQDTIQALAIKTSETTMRDTRVLIAAGKLAGSEEISVRYTLQTQQRAKLQTEQAIADARDKLARLIGMVGPGSLATPPIVTTETRPSLPDRATLQRLRSLALRRRGDYLAALDQIALQQARVRALKHRLLPELNLAGSVFATGLSGSSSAGAVSITEDEGYWASYKMNKVGWSAGLSLEVPLGNRKARGELRSAELELRRAQTAARLVQQEIAEELNRALRAVQLAHDQLQLTVTAHQVARTKLEAEQARYAQGRTTAHILAAVQAEVTKEQLNQAQAAADLNKAVVVLHATAGDLLGRLHVELRPRPNRGS
jgi:outer membrane protein